MAYNTNSGRTDSALEKLKLIEKALRSNNPDLGMSLAESLKDTLSFDRQSSDPNPKAILGGQHFKSTKELPTAWRKWSYGWNWFKMVDIHETAGIDRKQETVEISDSFLIDQITDPQREIRVARFDPITESPIEIPSQIYGETRDKNQIHCNILIQTDIAAHGNEIFLIFYGNENAERPCYETNLKTTGEGCGITVSNEHYDALLSPQNGQMERLIYKRQHSLELYAGGKGHGEPPGIDWGHDYVDEGQFQKFRMRCWSECPNYEIIQGPIMVQTRRWGFPHSPLHPLFTPSRIHMDVTYSFYSGLPFFYKESQFDVIKDVSIAAMRDDEWVFSGYSFSEMVWMDKFGKLHEGPVPSEQTKEIWAVGFKHPVSKDAFIALRLDHTAENYDSLTHGGAPTLHYDGHGQLWSRYPVDKNTNLKEGTSFSQKNAYLMSAYPENNAGSVIETLRHQMMNPVSVQVREFLPHLRKPQQAGTLSQPGETPENTPLKSAIWKKLREVRDDQLYTAKTNVVDLGYIYDVRVHAGVVTVLVTMPHRGRPKYEFLVTQGGGRVENGIQERVLEIPGVNNVVVEFTWNPPWSIHRMTDAGRKAVGV